MPGGAGRRSRAKANITITIAGERQHLVERDAAAPLDAQVLAGDRAARQCATAHSLTGVAARRPGRRRRRRTRVASEPARSSSWLATITVAPDAGGLAQRGVELVAAGGVEAGVRLVEQPQLGPPGDEAGQRGAPLLAGREAAHRRARRAGRRGRGGPCAASISASVAPDRGAPEADVLGDGEVEVEPVAVAEQADPRGAPRRGRRPGRSRAPCPRPGPAAAARRRPAAASSCRRRSGPRSSTISPRVDRAGRRRPAPGTLPSTATASSQLDDAAAVDPSPGDATGAAPSTAPGVPADGRVRRRPVGTVRRRAVVAVGSPAAAPRLALGRRHDRQGAHRHRAADVRLRRLPAVGHRARVRPGAGPARRRVRASCSPRDRRRRRRPPTPPTTVDRDRRPPTPTTLRRTVATTTTAAAAAEPVPAFADGDVDRPHRDPVHRPRRQGRRPASQPDDLKKGPGHYPDTPLPGQLGNAAIAGHRTTYGQPFYRLDEVAAGRRDRRSRPCRAASSTG